MTEEKKGMSKGCLVALIVVGVLAIIAIGLSVVCYIYQDEIMAWGLEKTTDIIAGEIKANLPDGVTEADVDRIFDKFRAAIDEKKLDAKQIQGLAAQFQTMMEDQKIDAGEAEELLQQIKEIVGELPSIPDSTE